MVEKVLWQLALRFDTQDFAKWLDTSQVLLLILIPGLYDGDEGEIRVVFRHHFDHLGLEDDAPVCGDRLWGFTLGHVVDDSDVIEAIKRIIGATFPLWRTPLNIGKVCEGESFSVQGFIFTLFSIVRKYVNTRVGFTMERDDILILQIIEPELLRAFRIRVIVETDSVIIG